MDRRWGSLSFLLGLLACGAEEEEGNAPPVSGGSAVSAGPGSGPVTGGATMMDSEADSSASAGPGEGTSTASGSGTGTGATGTGGSDSANTLTSGPVETGSETPCGDWAERYIECVNPPGSVVATENMCQAAVYDAGGYGAACANALEERYACLATLDCDTLAGWEIDGVVPEECDVEFMAVELNCPS